MNRTIFAISAALFLSCSILASATDEQGWVILYYAGGDNNVSYYMEYNRGLLTETGSGKDSSSGRYCTVLSLVDLPRDHSSKYHWILKKNYDYDGNPSSQCSFSGLVDMDHILYIDDNTNSGFDL